MVGEFLIIGLCGIILFIWYITDRVRGKRTFTFSNVTSVIACFVALVAFVGNAKDVAKLFNVMGTQTQIFQKQQLQLKNMQHALDKGNKSLLTQIKQMEVAQTQINDLQKIADQSNSLLNSQLTQMKKTNELVYEQLIRADSIATNTEKTLKNIHHQVEILSEMLDQEHAQVKSLGEQLKTSQEILNVTKSSYLFSTEEDRKRKRELIQSIINEIKSNDIVLDGISKLDAGSITLNFYFLKTDSWDSIKNMGWLGLLDNSQIVSNLSEYYAGISTLRWELQLVYDTEMSVAKALSGIIEKQTRLNSESRELAKGILKISPVILNQLEELLNSL